jgi:Ser/Thr protein kinase RdoA (MazF antagonist)
MSFWTYLRPADTGLPDEGTIGSMLRDLHAVLRTYPGSPPVLAPLGDIPVFLARPQTLLSAADVCLLTETYTRLTGHLASAATSGQVLHGDAGVGNLMAAGGRWVWHDFEDTCSGPAAWDLAATTASPRLDRSRILTNPRMPTAGNRTLGNLADAITMTQGTRADGGLWSRLNWRWGGDRG